MTCAFIGSSVGGAAFVFVRHLSVHKTHFVKIAFYFALFSTMVSPIGALVELHKKSKEETENAETEITAKPRYTLEVVILFFFVASLFFVAQVLVNLAYRYEKAGRLSPIFNIQMIFNLLFDVIYFGQVLTTQELAGASLIITCTIVISTLKATGTIK